MRRFVFFIPLEDRSGRNDFYEWYYKPLYDRHKAKILKQHIKKDDLVLTTFDVSAGLLITETYRKDGKLLSKIEDKRSEPYVELYNNSKDAKENLDKLGKYAVYDFIITIGKKTPGELFGLTIYGKSHEVGNSYWGYRGDEIEWIAMYGENLEHASDFDDNVSGRLFTSDLSKQKMGDDNFLFFRNAFSKSAKNYVMLVFPERRHVNEYSNLIDFLFKTTNEFRKQLYNDSVFDLDKLNLDSGSIHAGSDWDHFKFANGIKSDSKSITGRTIKAFFCQKLKTRYELALAKISGCITYGHALGAKNYDLLSTKEQPYYGGLYREDVILKNRFYQRYFGFGKPEEDTLLLPYYADFECDMMPIVAKPEMVVGETQQVMHYVFISGIDYRNKENPFDFIKCSNSRIDEIMQSGPTNDRLIFHCFDFLKGKKRTIVYSKGKDGVYSSMEAEPDELDSFSPVILSKDYKVEKNEFGEPENYFINGEYYLKKKKNYLLTMNHVHFLILFHINGMAPVKYPAKIKEIIFFTHGNERRPVIYNCNTKVDSNDSGGSGYRGDIYSVKSIDPRPSDWSLPWFYPEDANDEKTNILRSNLAEDAVLAIYGCNSNPNYARLIKAIVESDAYKLGNLSEDSLITLKNPGRELKQFLKNYTNLVKDEQSTPLKLKYRMGELLLFFRDLLSESYMSGMAVVTERPVYGGLPGLNTYIIETDKDTALINVESTFKKYFKFYQRHFGFENDSELVKKWSETSSFDGYWFNPDKTGGYAKYVHDFPWLKRKRLEDEGLEKEGLEGINF